MAQVWCVSMMVCLYVCGVCQQGQKVKGGHISKPPDTWTSLFHPPRTPLSTSPGAEGPWQSRPHIATPSHTHTRAHTRTVSQYWQPLYCLGIKSSLWWYTLYSSQQAWGGCVCACVYARLCMWTVVWEHLKARGAKRCIF